MTEFDNVNTNQVEQDKDRGEPRLSQRSSGFLFFGRNQGKKSASKLADELGALAAAFDNLAGSIIEAVIATDRDFLITGWNKAAENIYGWKADEVIGQKRSEIIPALLQDGNLWDESLALAAEHSQWEGEVFQRNRAKDRLVIHSTVRVSRDEKGDVTGIAFINRNLTEEKLMAEKTALSEAEFTALADTIPELAWLADERGQTYWYNRRWYDYTGTSLGEMAGTGWQKVHNPEYLPRLMKRVGSAFKEGKPWEDVFPLKGKDGKYRMFYTRAVPIHDKKGKVIRWLGTNTDIDEIRDAREAKKECEDSYASLLNNLQEAFVLFETVTDTAGKVQDLRFAEVNRAFETISGRNRSSLTGSSLYAVFPADANTYLENIARAKAEAKPQHFDWRSPVSDRSFSATAYIPKTGYAAVLLRQ
jgi:PAS domain S-box-containing protein